MTTTAPPPVDPVIQDALKRVAARKTFGTDEAHALMSAIMEGKADTTQLAALLMGLAVRGETVDEITGFAKAMREKSTRIHIEHEGRLVDTCGTGGAPTKTFNVGTTCAFIVAGAGVTVAKHGNRSVTSPSGSADVLEALGADLGRTPDEVTRIIHDVGIGFLFAPHHHPAMKHAIPARKALGIRTVFNVLGPLTNPAGAEAQVMGVYDPDLVEPIAHVLANLGTQEAYVVHGHGGMDELSTLGPNTVAHVKGQRVTTETIDPLTVGIQPPDKEAIGGLPPHESAHEVLAILKGAKSPRADLVRLNAAAAIQVSGKADTIEAAYELAKESIGSGAALAKLQAYVEATGGTLRGGGTA